MVDGAALRCPAGVPFHDFAIELDTRELVLCKKLLELIVAHQR